MLNAFAPKPLCFATLFAASIPASSAGPLVLREDVSSGAISVFRRGTSAPLLTQQAGPYSRPSLRPLLVPDGNGVLAEFSSSDFQDQPGISCGIAMLNGRDY